MASDTRPGMASAAGTLELLLQVMRGDNAAIEYVDPYLHKRAEAFEEHQVSGSLFAQRKPRDFASHNAAPVEAPVFKFKGPELIPGSRNALDPTAPRPPEAEVYAAPERARAGGSSVLRGAGNSVADPGRSRGGQQVADPGRSRGGQQEARPATSAAISQSRSAGSLQPSASSQTLKPSKPASSSSSQQLVPARPSSGSRTIYQDVDQAYNMSSSSTSLQPTDMKSLRARLTTVIDSKGGRRDPARESGSSFRQSSTASTALPRESRLNQSKEELLRGSDTPLTSRSEASDVLQDNVFSIVNDIVDTCVELEHAQSTLGRSDPRLGRTALPSTLPSAVWTARAALACAASAEAASAAAEVAAAASAEAAREAAKCVAAAKAATGKYNHLVDFVMSTRGESTMRPGGLPALEGGDSQRSQQESANSRKSKTDSQALGEDGICQRKMENEKQVVVRPSEIPLDNPVSGLEFKGACHAMGMAEVEAAEMFEAICKDQDQDIDGNLSFPMTDYLGELNINTDDHDAVKTFVDALKVARNGGGRPQTPEQSKETTERQAFDKVVRHMDQKQIPLKDAWTWTNEITNGFTEGVTVSNSEIEVMAKFTPEQYIKKVEQYMANPPTLCSSAGQVASKQICTRKVNEIIAKCKAEGTQFTDPEWDIRASPNKCLYVDSKAPGYDCTVAPPADYKRLTTIVKKAKPAGAMGAMGGMFGGGASRPKKAMKPEVFKGEIKPGDVVQGSIGTCFLLGAIGAMASHREKDLHKIFIKYDVDVGVYGIRFCLDGEWTYVIVDDWMPVDYNDQLIYARCKDPQEVWVPLLEKAFCKLHTCYEMCDGGEASEALNCFFGGISGKLTVTKAHLEDPSKYFQLLKNARDKGWLLTTGFVARPGAKSEGNGKCGEAMLPCGLVGGHAYSVLQIMEAQGNQLIQCRNPWGSGEWTGKWGDKDSQSWTPELKKAFGHVDRDDGKFWLSVADFVQNSGGVDYARTFGPNWKKATHYGCFPAVAMMGTAKRNWKGRGAMALSFSKGDQIRIKGISGEIIWGNLKGDRSPDPKGIPLKMVSFNERPVMRFDIVVTRTPGSNDPVNAVIMLMQQNVMRRREFTKLEDGQNYKDLNYAELQLIIINPKGEVEVKKQNCKRCVWGEVEISGGGLWKVYATCNDGKGSPCAVRTYLKGGTLSFKEVKGAKFSEVAPFLFDKDD